MAEKKQAGDDKAPAKETEAGDDKAPAKETEAGEGQPQEGGGREGAPATDAASGGLVTVRVLVRCVHGRPNDVVDLPADVVERDRGVFVDDNPAAVAAARALTGTEQG